MSGNVIVYVSVIVLVSLMFIVLKLIGISADLRYLRSIHDPSAKQVKPNREFLIYLACAMVAAIVLVMLLSGRI